MEHLNPISKLWCQVVSVRPHVRFSCEVPSMLRTFCRKHQALLKHSQSEIFYSDVLQGQLFSDYGHCVIASHSWQWYWDKICPKSVIHEWCLWHNSALLPSPWSIDGQFLAKVIFTNYVKLIQCIVNLSSCRTWPLLPCSAWAVVQRRAQCLVDQQTRLSIKWGRGQWQVGLFSTNAVCSSEIYETLLFWDFITFAP